MSGSRHIAYATAITVTVFGFAAPAFADECSDTIAKVEEAAASAQLADQDMASIKGLIEEARTKQTAGDTDGCTMTLADAKAALQIE